MQNNDIVKAAELLNFAQKLPVAKIPKKKVIPYPMDVINPKVPGGYCTMLEDGTVVEHDDYAAASQSVFKRGSSDVNEIAKTSLELREEFSKKTGMSNILPYGGLGGDEYNVTNLADPETIQSQVMENKVRNFNMSMAGRGMTMTQSDDFWNSVK